MKTSLKDTIEKEYTNTPTVEQAIVQANPTEQVALVTPADRFFSNEDMVGDFSAKDVVWPRLNLVQAVGPLSQVFTPGQVILNKDQVIGGPDKPVTVTLLRMKKIFEEKLPYGSEIMPRVFETENAAREAGLAPLYDKQAGDMPRYSPVLDCEILVENKGDDEQGNFSMEFGGKRYARALFTLRSTAYNATGKQFISAAMFGLRAGLHTAYWEITPKREKVGKNMVWLPRARLVNRHTPEFCAWAAELKR